jgi:hypothetical protein
MRGTGQRNGERRVEAEQLAALITTSSRERACSRLQASRQFIALSVSVRNFIHIKPCLKTYACTCRSTNETSLVSGARLRAVLHLFAVLAEIRVGIAGAHTTIVVVRQSSKTPYAHDTQPRMNISAWSEGAC